MLRLILSTQIVTAVVILVPLKGLLTQKGASPEHCQIHSRICKTSHLVTTLTAAKYSQQAMAVGQNPPRQGGFFRGSNEKGGSQGQRGNHPWPSPFFALVSFHISGCCVGGLGSSSLVLSSHPLALPPRIGKDRWQDRHRRTREQGGRLEGRRERDEHQSVMYPRVSDVFAIQAMPKNPTRQKMTVSHFPLYKPFMVRLSERTCPEDFLYHHLLQGIE